MRGGWAPHHTPWFWLLLGSTVSAADRALTGPVVTWMIGDHGSSGRHPEARRLGPGSSALFLFVRETAKSQVLGRREAQDTESRLGPRVQPSQRTTV